MMFDDTRQRVRDELIPCEMLVVAFAKCMLTFSMAGMPPPIRKHFVYSL